MYTALLGKWRQLIGETGFCKEFRSVFRSIGNFVRKVIPSANYDVGIDFVGSILKFRIDLHFGREFC